jgi:hypothetical protein
METRRWTNPSQPQTLQIAVFLLYIDAFFALLGFNLLIAVASAAAGFGIANEKKWGYVLGVIISVIALLFLAQVIYYDGLSRLFDLRVLLASVFPVAQFALLVHPQSRDYQRIWFS